MTPAERALLLLVASGLDAWASDRGIVWLTSAEATKAIPASDLRKQLQELAAEVATASA